MTESEPSLTVEEWMKKSFDAYKTSGDVILLPISKAFEAIEFTLSQAFDRKKIVRALEDLDYTRKRSMEAEESNADLVRIIVYGFIDKVQCVILHLIQKIDETDVTSEKKALMEEVNKLKEKIGKLTDENGLKIDEISALKNSIHNKDNELAAVKSELEDKATEVYVGRSTIEQLQKELAETKEKANADLTTANTRAIGLKKLVLQYKAQSLELDAKLKEVQLEKEAIEGERDYLNANLEKMTRRNKILASNNGALRRSHAELGMKIEDDPLFNENEVAENSHLLVDSDNHLPTTPNFTHSFPVEPKEEPMDNYIDDNQAITVDTQMHSLRNVGDETDFVQEEMLHENLGPSETVKVGKRRRASRFGTKVMDDLDFSDSSDEDYVPASKKSRADSVKKTMKDKKDYRRSRSLVPSAMRVTKDPKMKKEEAMTSSSYGRGTAPDGTVSLNPSKSMDRLVSKPKGAQRSKSLNPLTNIRHGSDNGEEKPDDKIPFGKVAALGHTDDYDKDTAPEWAASVRKGYVGVFAPDHNIFENPEPLPEKRKRKSLYSNLRL